jgi:hypothetical protein
MHREELDLDQNNGVPRNPPLRQTHAAADDPQQCLALARARVSYTQLRVWSRSTFGHAVQALQLVVFNNAKIVY